MTEARRAAGRRRVAGAVPATGARPLLDDGRAAQRLRAAQARRATEQGLRRAPVTFFLVVLAVAALSLAWRRATQVWSAPAWVGPLLFWVALLGLVVVGLLYALKWLRDRADARAEAGRPVLQPDLGIVTAAVLVVAAAGEETVAGLARLLWWVGALGQVAITVWLLDALLHRPDRPGPRPGPSWLVPAVGALTMALGARSVGSTEFAWLGFGAGIALWLGLWPLVAIRPDGAPESESPQDVPAVAWLVATPAVAMWAWQALTGNVDDPIGRVLLAATLLFLAVVLVRLRLLLAAPFTLTAWAYPFATSSAAVAAITMAGARPALGYNVLASFLLTVATVLSLTLGALTVRALLRRLPARA